MFKLSDADGKLTMTEVKFSKDSLDTNDTFLIDNGKMIYIWCGKGSSKQEKDWEFLLLKNIKNQPQKNLVALLHLLMKDLKNSQ